MKMILAKISTLNVLEHSINKRKSETAQRVSMVKIESLEKDGHPPKETAILKLRVIAAVSLNYCPESLSIQRRAAPLDAKKREKTFLLKSFDAATQLVADRKKELQRRARLRVNWEAHRLKFSCNLTAKQRKRKERKSQIK